MGSRRKEDNTGANLLIGTCVMLIAYVATTIAREKQLSDIFGSVAFMFVLALLIYFVVTKIRDKRNGR